MSTAGRHINWERRRADAGALLLFVAVFLLFFWWLFWEQKFTVASDSFAYALPMRTVVWEMIRAGQLPLWTPHILSGYPLLAMSQLAVGYPLTWGYLILPNYWAEQIYLSAPHLLAPAFTYAFCRGLNRSRLASVLAALAFTYGGVMIGVVSLYGVMSNGVIWLPLVLLAVERARKGGGFSACLLGGGMAYAMSVLNGYPQGYLYAGMITAGYGLFASLFPLPSRAPEDGDAEVSDAGDALGHDGSGAGVRLAGWLSWDRWKPLAVAVLSLAAGACVGAFQILETMRALRRSARARFTTELFYGDSPGLVPYELGSLAAPLYNWEIPAYVAPLALAAAAVAFVSRRARRDPHVYFWLATAAAGWLLMLGAKSPLYRLLMHLPVNRHLQVPMRFSVVWTFAAAMLAAYGWDALTAAFAGRAKGAETAGDRPRTFAAASLLLLSAAAAVFWWRAVSAVPPAETNPQIVGLLRSPYILWKLAFTALLFASAWHGFRVAAPRARHALLLAAIVIGCCAEAYFPVRTHWGHFAKPAARYRAVSDATRFLSQFPPEQNRVYTRVELFAEEHAERPRMDPPNLTALHGLHNVAGYEPLILDRYSRALGGVLTDTVAQRHGYRPNLWLLSERAHVLDLLNTTHFASYVGLASKPQQITTREGVTIADSFSVVLRPGQSGTLSATESQGDMLYFVSFLTGAVEVGQGEEVARVRVHGADGGAADLSLRAGVDTAEEAHESPGNRGVVRHAPAPVFDDRAGDAGNSFRSYRYLSKLPLGGRIRVDRVEITNIAARATLHLWAATLYDSQTRASQPLLPVAPSRWRTVYNRDDVLILRNARALPRAWLVAEAEAVDGEEALSRISGGGDFDPRRTALLEVSPDTLPELPGGPPPPDATARHEYVPNGIDVETFCETDALLVVSESNFPGWEATVDGRPAQIHSANFITQAVHVTAGRRRVEFRYRSPAARNGALLSLATLLAFCALALDARRRAHHSKQLAQALGRPREHGP